MSNEMKTDTTSPVNTETRYLGRVKWFNNKTGYGFATIISEDTEADRVGEDIFVHHSSITIDTEQYKYLVQGEYVAFNLKESDSDSHPFQADNLAGICGGKLMCETRNEQRLQREAHDESQGDRRDNRGDNRNNQQRGSGRDRRQRARPRGSGPRDDGKVWALVQPDERSNEHGERQ